MGFFKWISGQESTVSRSEFPRLIERLSREFRALREQWLFGALSTLKAEGAGYDSVSPILEEGSPMDSTLKAFQLTCVVAFASKQGYFSVHDHMEFERQLKTIIAPRHLNATTECNERYLDCGGDIDCLSDALSDDILKLIGDPDPLPPVRAAFKAGAAPLAILSQAVTAVTFAYHKTEKKLKSPLKIT